MADTKICFDRLNDFNWPTWRFRMELMLMKEDLWSVVQDAKPVDVTSAWTRRDEKARAVIGLALEDSQLSHIMEVTNAKEMWEKLRGYHERGSLSNKIHVLRRLCSMRLDEDGNMSDHLVEVSQLVHRLARMNESLKEHLVVAILLSSLPESYSPLVTALEGRPEEDLKLDYVKGKLLDEWRRKNEGHIHESEKVMKSVVQVEDRRRIVRVCYHCRQQGHFQRNCPILLEETREEIRATMKKQDKARSMTMLDPDPGSGSSQEVCFTTATGGDIPPDGGWILDTGCTKHMTGVVRNFSSRVSCKEKVLLADGRTVNARGSGKTRIVGRGAEGESVDIMMKEVLYVPGLTGSVLSVSRITEQGYAVVFGAKDCRIMDGSSVIAVGENRCGLYYLKQ